MQLEGFTITAESVQRNWREIAQNLSINEFTASSG